jgi:hypothetical protein
MPGKIDRIALIALALALVGCSGGPAASAPTPSPQPTAPPVAAPAPSPTVAAPPAPSPTAAVAPTAAPTAAATAAATTAPTAIPATALPTAAAQATAPQPGPSIGGEILFLRDGALVALDVAGGGERALADGVSSFAATPDGRLLAAVRGEGAAAEIWLMGRDGSGLRQLTANDRAESNLGWSPDGLTLAYSAARTPAPRAPSWQSWGEWCADAEARLVEAAGGPERTLGTGCEPAFSPDGRRVAFTTAPTAPGEGADFPGAANTISIVNRQGANGWSVAQSAGAGDGQGYLVYGPSWAPDGGRVAYQRFVGYQALVDINLTEASSSFERRGEPLGLGAGWLLAPTYAPDGAQVAVVEHNFSDARGFSGYDIWQVTVLRLGEEQELAMPSETIMLQAATADSLDRVTAAAWSPDGAALAVALPAGWEPGLGGQQPVFADEDAGELWRWRPGAPPEQKLADGVDFASPLLWLPPPPALVASEAGISLAVPADWGLREGPPDYRAADGPAGRAIAARLVAGAPPGGPAGLFPELLAAGASLAEPFALPDGSTLRGVSGAAPDGRPLAGLMRLSADGAAAAVYLADPDRWPLEHARAMALLAASGR